MKKKPAYTLIELMIVLAIIVLLTLFGLPAFNRYRQVSEFNAKVDEVKELFNLAHTMAMNPADTTNSSYYVYHAQNFYWLAANNNQAALRGVALSANEVIYTPPGGYFGVSYTTFICPTAMVNSRSQNCNNIETPIRFTDYNINKVATFTISNDPFRVDVTTTNLQ